MYTGHFDGASRGNPGPAGAGAYLVDPQGRIVWKTACPLGLKTNNEAEYAALILLLEEAARREAFPLVVQGDSRLVICQVKRLWKINKPHLRDLAQRVWELSRGREVVFEWVPREQNALADELSNEALDG